MRKALLFVVLLCTAVTVASAQILTDANARLPSISGASAWADYDGDGHLDLVVSGCLGHNCDQSATCVFRRDGAAYSQKTYLYRNDGGSFVSASNPFPAMGNTACASWVDFDNDGDLDVAMSGTIYSGSTGTNVMKLYQNDGGSFSEVTDFSLTSAPPPYGWPPSFSWGDCDNNGDLDLLVSSDDRPYLTYNHRFVTRLCINDTPNKNTPPLPPAGLRCSYNGRKSVFSWNALADAETPAAALTYNLRVGRSSGADDIVPSLSDQTGCRWMPARDNAGKTLSRAITNPPDGTYYWCVQAVDTGLMGSAWAPKDVLVVSTHIISGTVRSVGGNPLANVVVTAGTGHDSCTTGSDGHYSLRVPAGWSGTVQPVHDGYLFDPVSRSYTEITSDLTGQDLAATPVLASVDVSLLAVCRGCVAWADYDSDGDLDLIMMGTTTGPTATPMTKLFQNNGGVLTEVTTDLEQLYAGTLAWGDYDRDGDLDLAIGGWKSSSTYFSTVYRNDSGTFVDIHANFGSIRSPCFAWGDYDNDGDLDLAVAGDGNTASVSSTNSHLYRNDNGAFVDSGESVPSYEASAVTLADWDSDGDLDLCIGSDIYGPLTYRNVAGTFSSFYAVPEHNGCGNSSWIDYDCDGDLDILLHGRYGTKLYRNDSGSFTLVATLPGVMSASVAWGDYDNDGDPDLLIAGDTLWGSDVSPITKLYRNDNGVFADTQSDLAQVWSASMAWGDYDGDGRLDLVITGDTGSTDSAASPVTKLYHNSALVANSRPLPPTSLQPELNGRDVTFRWDAGSDAETPSSGLYYNLRVGTSPGANDIYSGSADTTTGLARQPGTGNVQSQRSWIVKNLIRGTYYWSVQSIDAGYQSSEWAPEQAYFADLFKVSGFARTSEGVAIPGVTITLSTGETSATDTTGYYEFWLVSGWSVVLTPSKSGYQFDPVSRSYDSLEAEQADVDFISVSGYCPIDFSSPASGARSCAWGDYDNDGDMDLAVSASTGTFLYRNDGETFVNVSGTSGLTSVTYCAAWADYDCDGDLDLAISGDPDSSSASTYIFRNDTGLLVDSGMSMSGATGPLAWGDYDNDGDPDLAIGTRIYRNDRGNFVSMGALCSNTPNCAVWADYDNDGDIDLTVIGHAGSSGSYYAKVFNNTNGTLTDSGISLPQLPSGSVDWGDYDEDGDLDLLLTGGSYSYETKLYRNDSGTLVDAQASLPVIPYSSAAWGDFDSDGKADIVIAGQASGVPVTRVYHNNGDGTFSDACLGFTGVVPSSLACADCDSDGNLDLAVCGDAEGVSSFRIYRNDSSARNNAPAAPSGLSVEGQGTSATFIWTAATDAETPSTGLSYNLRVGTSPGAGDVMCGMADSSSGLRRVPAIGNVGKRLSWTIHKLPPGPLYWNVQAIDSIFGGSPWAEEQTVTVDSIKISGRVRTPEDTGLQGVTITARNSADGATTDSTTTANDGSYALITPSGWSGTVTLTPASGYYFDRTSISYTDLLDSQTSQDYIATPHFQDIGAQFDSPYASLAWGDYDGDGLLDLAVGCNATDPQVTKLYRNTGNGFIDSGIALPVRGNAAWGDYDNDGRLDIAISGCGYTGSSNVTKLFHNNGDGSFTDIGASLPALIGSIAWADYDGDGDLDLAFSGNRLSSSALHLTTVFRNDDGHLVDAHPGLPTAAGALCWTDYDGDGDPDLVVVASNLCKIYRNDDGIFQEADAGLTSQGVIDIFGPDPCVVAGDYDGDGDQDLAIVTANASVVYKNTAGHFTKAFSLPTVKGGSAAWGDYDNDGDLDIVIVGNSGAKVLRNDRTGFTDIGALLAGTGKNVAWGDYDADGRLDLAILGLKSSKYFVSIYRNRVLLANTAPQPPVGLSATASGVDVTFDWSAGNDAEAPAPGLSYNLRVGATPGGGDVCAAEADLSTGTRRINAIGNGGQRLSRSLKGLLPGTYYWSVQSIDTAYAGSAWADEESIVVEGIRISGQVLDSTGEPVTGLLLSADNGGGSGVTDSSGCYELPVPIEWTGTVRPSKPACWFVPRSRSYEALVADQSAQDYTAGPFFTQTDDVLTGPISLAAWGDYDSDGDLDLAAKELTSSSSNATRIYRNDGGHFTPAESVLGDGGTYAWADYDNDGDIDLTVCSKTATGVFQNNGGAFTQVSLGSISPQGTAAWGDYDNDGWLDLAVYSTYVCSRNTKMYHNNGSTLADCGVVLKGGNSGDVAWIDCDNDGDLDLFETGASYDTALYQNADASFEEWSAAFSGLVLRSQSWGDFDNDGDLDVALGPNAWGVTSVYRNDGGTFTKLSPDLPQSDTPKVAWGDFDNDGNADLVVAGGGSTRVYRNDAGMLIDTDATLPSLESVASVNWADYDSDGDLDLLICGGSNNGSLGVCYLLRNDCPFSNHPPSAPTALRALSSEDELTLSWSRAVDQGTYSPGLNYNLRVGATRGGEDVLCGMSDLTTGQRRIPAIGNVQQNLSWTLKGLPEGIYYWSVQAIDAGSVGSQWATERVAAVGNVPISAAKAGEDGKQVICGGLVVTAVFGDSFYAEADDRSSGIRVSKAGHGVDIGMVVFITGRMETTDQGERYIAAESVVVDGSGSVAPLILTNRALGGGPDHFVPETGAGQRGVEDGLGLSNIGLLVTAAGRVTAIGNGFFYIDDGSRTAGSSTCTGIMVECAGLTRPAPGSYISVTGISSIVADEGRYYRRLLMRADSDIVIYQP